MMKTCALLARALPALLLGAACSAQALPEADLAAGGPPVAFTRQGASVCASYSIDGAFELYEKRVFARSGSSMAAISGIPHGKAKPGAPAAEATETASFKACAKAASDSATVEWIDQSCAAAQGLCLPPRGFEIDAAGKARPMDSSKVGAAFAMLMGSPSAKAAGDGWGAMSFNPR